MTPKRTIKTAHGTFEVVDYNSGMQMAIEPGDINEEKVFVIPMTQPITAKSPSAILEEYKNPLLYLIDKNGAFNPEGEGKWLRSSLTSLLLWAVDNLPLGRLEVDNSDDKQTCDHCGSQSYIGGRNIGISDCRQKLIDLAHSIEE